MVIDSSYSAVESSVLIQTGIMSCEIYRKHDIQNIIISILVIYITTSTRVNHRRVLLSVRIKFFNFENEKSRVLLTVFKLYYVHLKEHCLNN